DEAQRKSTPVPFRALKIDAGPPVTVANTLPVHPKSELLLPVSGRAAGEIITEVHRQEAVLKAGALQNAILNSANFSSIATDEKGVIQIFNVGAERMLG